MNETALVLRAAGGDVDAFCTLYGLYRQKLFQYAYFRLNSTPDAEDAVQDCMLKAFENLPALKKPEAFGAWLYTILSHECTACLKQRARRDDEDIDSYIHTMPAARDDFAGVELRDALEKLPDDEQNIVLLSVVSGLKSKEIAKITGLRPGNVRQKLRRSLSKMRRSLT